MVKWGSSISRLPESEILLIIAGGIESVHVGFSEDKTEAIN
jgi:hypothetical protein